MKKFVSILLALTLVFNLGIVAFAAENTTLTITGETGRVYNGYKLLNLTTSLKTGEHHTDHEGDHTNDCYNFAYTVNEDYRAVLQAETLANGRNDLWDETGKPSNAAGVTDAQILNYLANQTSDDGDVYHTMRQVADRLYRAILAAGIEPDAEEISGTNDIIDQGYWMFADVTELDGNAANSLVMVDTKGQENLTVTPKTALPTVEKKVKDIDDSKDGYISDNPWIDSADHDIGDTVPFKLTATLPSNFRAFIVRDADGNSTHPYKLVFHDTMSAGLTLKADSVKVYMYTSKTYADTDADVKDYFRDVTAYFTLKTTGLTDNCSFEVACADVIKIPDVTTESVFLVYYEAILNENAVMGGSGNTNTVYLEFTNDPYGDATGETEEDKVAVFTYNLTINKTDSHGHALAGAGFTMYKKDLEGNYSPIAVGVDAEGGAVYELTGEAMTAFSWEGLDDGDYKLVETTVPEGFNKMSDIVFSISAIHSENASEPVLLSLDGGVLGTGVVETGTITQSVVNNSGTVLPETGAEGTFLLISLSTMLVIVAAVFMITRKKMSIYED